MIRIGGHERGVGYSQHPDFTPIPAWSRGKKPYSELSPFKIGPVNYAEYGANRTTPIFECFWQGHKVYDEVSGNKEFPWIHEVHVQKIGDNYNDYIINDNYFRWSNAVNNSAIPLRRPNGRAIPEFALFDGARYGLIESRINIYIKYYQELLRNHSTYKSLLARFCVGENLLIIEPDGPSPRLFPGGILVDESILAQMVFVSRLEDFAAIVSDDPEFCTKHGADKNKYVPLGHGAVIAITLLEDQYMATLQ